MNRPITTNFPHGNMEIVRFHRIMFGKPEVQQIFSDGIHILTQVDNIIITNEKIAVHYTSQLFRLHNNNFYYEDYIEGYYFSYEGMEELDTLESFKLHINGLIEFHGPDYYQGFDY